MDGCPDLRRHGIIGLTADSRRVEPGFLFLAVPGERADGRAYVREAVARGAGAILAPAGTALDLPEGIPLFLRRNPRRTFALLAASLYGAQPGTVAAVTGTSGKTSVADFIRQLWTALSRPAASIGTLGLIAPDRQCARSLTTPDPVSLHRDLAHLAEGGIDHVAVEASSHGLAQHRLDGVSISAGVFTNLSRDHLDYHPDAESYFQAKRRLFSEVMAPGGLAVVNADDALAERIAQAARERRHEIWRVGRNGFEIRIGGIRAESAGQVVDFRMLGRRQRLRLPLIGEFQAANALAALAVVAAQTGDIHAAADAAERLRGVRGRLELAVRTHSGAAVYVDYAHKPGALEAVLRNLRPYVPGRLVIVLGAGGDRDRGKRAEMGAAAARLADETIVTDDNPRTEDPAAIRAAVRAGAPDSIEIADRTEAIAAGIAMVGADDALLIAGKGHETGQIVGTRTLPFDDAETARNIAEQRT